MSAESAARRELARLKGIHKGNGRTTLGLDPGTAATGIAVVKDGDPVFVNVVRAKGGTAEDRLPDMCERVALALRSLYAEWQPDTVAIEWQAIRPSDKRPNDILHLAIVLGAALAEPRPTFSTMLTPLPQQWKGSVKADTFVERIRKQWPQATDFLHDCPGHLQHNGLDAVGLAAWAIHKRMPWQ